MMMMMRMIGEIKTIKGAGASAATNGQKCFNFYLFIYLFIYFGSCGRLSWLNCQLSRAR